MHPTLGAPKYVKQTFTELKEKIECKIIIVGDFNNLFTSMDRLSRQKINYETSALNDTLDQMDLIDITELSIQKQQHTHFFQLHIEHSPGYIAC